MTTQEFKVLVAQLWATRASVDAALTVLGAFDANDGDTGTDADACTHPIDERIDETTMGGPEGWRCRICAFSTLPKKEPSTVSTDTSREN